MSTKNDDLFTAKEIADICRAHLAHNKLSELVLQQLNILAWRLSTIGGAPSGFLSQQLRLTVTYRRNSGDGNAEFAPAEETTFFVKTLATGSAAQRDYVSDYGAFEKEIRLYADLLPTLIAINGDDVPFAAHCYLGRGPNLLVFEDLQREAFRNCHGRDGLLDMQHLLLTVEALARLHAASFIFEKQHHQSLIASYPQHLIENAYPDRSGSSAAGRPSRHAWIAMTIRTLVALFGEIADFHDCPRVVGERIATTLAQIYEFVLPSTRFRNCFGHGDLWKNNVMFKYAELSPIGEQRGGNDGVVGVVELPVEVKFVDFQLARYAPPALDLMTICMMVTSRQFRNEHLQRVLDVYYTHLDGILRQHGLCAAVELPRDEFDASCRFYRLAGLIECCLFSHMTLLPVDVAADLTADGFGVFMGSARVEICVRAFREDGLYRERMTDMLVGLVDEFILERK